MIHGIVSSWKSNTYVIHIKPLLNTVHDFTLIDWNLQKKHKNSCYLWVVKNHVIITFRFTILASEKKKTPIMHNS